jgi:hypothetical protein
MKQPTTQNDFCINCQKPATHYHHVVPKSLGGNDGTNIVPLCDKCHSIIHGVSFSNGVISHSELTKKGLQKAKEKGSQIGRKQGDIIETNKAKIAKAIIEKYNYDFNGTLSDAETILKANISRNTFYKYKRELKNK